MLTEKEQKARENVIVDLSEGIIEGLQKDAITLGCESVLKVMFDGLSNLLGKD